MFDLMILNVFLAASFTFSKDAVLATPPLFFTAIRMITSGLLFLGFIQFAQNRSCTVPVKHYPWFLGMSVFHIYIPFCAEFFGIQYISSAKVCLFYNLSPLITALLVYIVFKEKLTTKKLLGLIIGFIAFLPLLYESTSAEQGLTSLGFISLAEGMVLSAVISACVGWILMKKITHELGYSFIFVNGVAMFFGGLLALITSLLIEQIPLLAPLISSWDFIRPFIMLIIIGNIIVYNLYAYLLHKYSATIVSFFSSLSPLFAALFGWFFLKEHVSTTFFVTFSMVIIGLYIFYQEELQKKLYDSYHHHTK